MEIARTLIDSLNEPERKALVKLCADGEKIIDWVRGLNPRGIRSGHVIGHSLVEDGRKEGGT